MRKKAVIKTISTSKVLIVGLARNCQETIEREVQIINSAFSEAETVNWLVIESDSDDETLSTLEKLSESVKFAFITLGKLRKQYPKRTERIAKCRNRYLQELRVNKKYDNIDYVVVADLDGVNSELTKTAVESCWKFAEEWDACFANQSKVYYDIWALRHKTWCPNDCWQTYEFFLNHGMSKHRALHAAVYSRMLNIDSNEDPIEVNSAFGWLGIYKKHAILTSAYIGLDDNKEEICEHVNLHTTMRDKGLKLYIIPSLINCGWIEHSKHLQFRAKTINNLLRSIKEFFTNTDS